MRSTNTLLLDRASVAASAPLVASEPLLEATSEQDKSTKQLLDKWASLNLVRGVIVGVASVLGLWAVIGEAQEPLIIRI
jgi:hypothetical protein